MLSAPFWNDEAWVAVTTRYPLHLLPAVTSSTPIGFSVLLRVFVTGPNQTLRLLPLLFTAACVPAAYMMVRGLHWPNRCFRTTAASLGAVWVLFAPSLLVRDDLKQYAADASVAVTLLAVTAWVEREFTRRALAVLVVTAVMGMLVSDVAGPVGVAAFSGLAATWACRKQWRALKELIAAAAFAAVGMAVVYFAFDAPNANTGLVAYWKPFFVPIDHGPGPVWHYLYVHVGDLRHYFGLGPIWVGLPLVLIGLATLARLGQPAVVVTVLALAAEMVTLSGINRYPLLDERTSTFVMVVTVLLAAIGVAGAGSTITRVLPPAGVVMALLATAVFLAGSWTYVRSHRIPPEDVRSQVNYIAAHRRPGDIVLVNGSSNWGFAYYWRANTPSRTPSEVIQGYFAHYPSSSGIIIASGRDQAQVTAALSEALAEVPAGGRLWLVLSHVTRAEDAAWARALHEGDVTAHGLIAGLTVITPVR